MLAAAALLLMHAATASAAACDTSWTGDGGDSNWFNAANWSTNAVPTGSNNVCIQGSASVTVVIDSTATGGGEAQANSLTLGGASGTQTLVLQGDTSGTSPSQTEALARLVLPQGGTIGANGVLEFTNTCADATSCTDGGAAELDLSGKLENQGTISVLSGKDSGAAGRMISGGTLINDGLIETDGNGASLMNSDIFKQGSGTTSPDTSALSAFPGDPAVIMQGGSLIYTGTGASTIVTQGSVSLVGNLAQAQSLVVEGGSGNSCATGLVSASSSFTNAGVILLAEPGTCGSELSVGPSSATASTATLTNTGAIETEAVGQSGTTYLNGNILNSGGTITTYVPLQYEGTDPSSTTYSGATLDNTGTIHLGTGALTVPANAGSTVDNDTSGLITDVQTIARPRGPVIPVSGKLEVDSGNTFDQGAGTTNPASATVGFPAVYVNGGTLSYTGTGSSLVTAEGSVTMSGDLNSGQTLTVQGQSVGSTCTPGTATESGSFTNAGTILLTSAGTGSATCGGEVVLSSGTLTNSGSIMSESGLNPTLNALSGSVTSSGTIAVDQTLDFHGSGTTLTQTGGTTSVGSGQTLDLTGSAGTFELQGGLLDGAGSITGAVSNSGANVEPGDPGGPTPGRLSLTGSYTQGAGGTLTALIAASTTPGSDYSELLASGGSTLGGTLTIVPVSTFSPQVGQTFEIVNDGSAARTGVFGTIVGQFPSGPGAGYDPSYDPDDVTLDYVATKSLDVSKAGKGTGTVTSSPAGINCGSTCQASYFSSATVTLSAHAAAGSVFAGWSGACSGSTSTCHVTMSQPRAVTAKFLRVTTTTLSSSLNPARVGEKVTYSARVSRNPGGGTVKFTSNGSPIAGCGAVAVSASTANAGCVVKYTSAGTRHIVATYSGDRGFAHSTSTTLTEKVNA